MASQTGTATDYKDLFNELRDYCVANGYTVERDLTQLQFGDPAGRELILSNDFGSGNTFHFGLQTREDSTTGYFNFRLNAFTGYNASEIYNQQPGISPDTYVPLQNSTMTYWMFVNVRRFCMVVRTGSSYQFMYAGLINTFATNEPDEYPYPMCVLGCTHVFDTVFNSNLLAYSSVPNPGSTSNVRTLSLIHI